MHNERPEDLRMRLLKADAARRRAMIEADVDTLNALLAEDLCWTHSSGAVEDKGAFVDAIATAAVSYEALEVEADEIRAEGTLVVHQGRLRGRASRGGQSKALQARFLAVWRSVDERLELIAWQSTNTTV